MIEIQEYDETKPLTGGAWRIDESAYHADPCQEPSLSSSVAKLVVKETPAHARFAHPRLNPAYTPTEASAAMDFGSACHRLLLGDGPEIVRIYEKDYRKDIAKEERESARLDGMTPLLNHKYIEAERVVAAAHEQLKDVGIDLALASAEISVVTQDPSGAWLRCRIDGWSADNCTLLDYKVGGTSPNPEVWGKQAANMGYDIQDAFYRRAVESQFPELAGRLRFLFIAQSDTEPYYLSVNELSEYDRTISARKVDYAIETWARCLASGKWPAYPAQVNRVVLPTWHHAAWIEREEMEGETS